MSYRLEIPDSKLERLKELDSAVQERITKKLDEIEKRLNDFDLEPEKAIEKRLKGRLHPLLQQRVGDYRLWFKEDNENNVVYLYAVKHKENAKNDY